MAKATRKLQVTVPKALTRGNAAARARLFDQATRRQRERQAACPAAASERGWTREDLYDGGHPR